MRSPSLHLRPPLESVLAEVMALRADMKAFRTEMKANFKDLRDRQKHSMEDMWKSISRGLSQVVPHHNGWAFRRP